MRVDLFDFDLDKELIAKEPANPRDASRLLDLSEEGVTVDRHFYDLPDILNFGDVLVFNDTKVIPARLYGKRGESRGRSNFVSSRKWSDMVGICKKLKASASRGRNYFLYVGNCAGKIIV